MPMRIFAFVSAALWPLSLVYEAVIRARNWLFDRGVLPAERPPCHVISVGNLTIGGAGKTPAVIYLARRLRAEGKAVVVISRGYRRHSRGFCLVSDGHRVLVSAREAGDEPFLLARRLNGVPVLVDKDRGRAARIAVRRFGAEVVVLDDGFQHRRMARDEDHVLISTQTGFGNNRLLPAGPLREPKSSLARATHVWITKVSDPNVAAGLVSEVGKVTQARIRLARHRPVAFRMFPQGHELPLAALQGKRAFCFAGIAEPQLFFKTVVQLGVRVAGKQIFRDHVVYSTGRVRRIYGRAEASQAEVLLTTEKDAVKFPVPQDGEPPLYCLVIDFDPVADAGTADSGRGVQPAGAEHTEPYRKSS